MIKVNGINGHWEAIENGTPDAGLCGVTIENVDGIYESTEWIEKLEIQLIDDGYNNVSVCIEPSHYSNDEYIVFNDNPDGIQFEICCTIKEV